MFTDLCTTWISSWGQSPDANIDGRYNVGYGPGSYLILPNNRLGQTFSYPQLSRAFASQGSCYVLMAAGIRLPKDIPERFREISDAPDLTGDSGIIDPRGEVIAGPATGGHSHSENIHERSPKSKDSNGCRWTLLTPGHFPAPVNRNPLKRILEQPSLDSSALANGVSGGQFPLTDTLIDQQQGIDHQELDRK